MHREEKTMPVSPSVKTDVPYARNWDASEAGDYRRDDLIKYLPAHPNPCAPYRAAREACDIPNEVPPPAHGGASQRGGVAADPQKRIRSTCEAGGARGRRAKSTILDLSREPAKSSSSASSLPDASAQGLSSGGLMDAMIRPMKRTSAPATRISRR